MIPLIPSEITESLLKRFAGWFVILLLMAFYGCAAVTREAAPVIWYCDPRADAAFENGEWEKARDAHEALLDNQPGNCLALYHLGYIQGRLGERSAEIQLYRDAVDCGYTNDDKLYFNLGMALGDTDRFHQACDAFKQAVAIAPGTADNYFGLGLMERSVGDDTAAENALIKAVSLEPRHRVARTTLARLYIDQGRWAEGRAQLEAVLSEDPDDSEAQELWQTMLSRQRRLFDPPDDDR